MLFYNVIILKGANCGTHKRPDSRTDDGGAHRCAKRGADLSADLNAHCGADESPHRGTNGRADDRYADDGAHGSDACADNSRIRRGR